MASSIVVEFEVLPDDAVGAGDRSPQQVCFDLQHQLSDPGSILRRGDFARFAATASLSGPGIESSGAFGGDTLRGPLGNGVPFPMEDFAEVPPPPPPRNSEAQAFPSARGGAGAGFGQQTASFDAPPPADPMVRPSAYGSSNPEWQGLSNADLVDRIAHLERQLQRTAAGGRQDAVAPAPIRPSTGGFAGGQATEEKCWQLQQRLEAVERELREANEAAQMWRQRHEQCELKLKDREQLLVHAKEMWMKENVRASRLADALTTAEDKLADQEKRLAEVADRYSEAQREVRSLQHLVGNSNGEGFGSDPYSAEKKNGRMLGMSGELTSTGVSRPPGTALTFDTSLGTRDMLGTATKAVPSTSPGMAMADDGRPLPPMPMDPETNADRFRRLCQLNDAVLYEDELIQVGIKAEYAGREGQLAVFFGNKGSASLHAFTAQYFVKEEQALRLSASPLSQQLEADKQVVQRVSIVMQEPFAEPPWLRVQFLLPDTSPRRIQMKLPVVLTKFLVGREMTPQEYFQSWRQQHFVLNEATSIVHLASRFRGTLVHVARSIVFGGSLRMHHGVDTNPDNFVLVGQLSEASRSAGTGDFDLDRSRGDAFGLPASSGMLGDREQGLTLARVEVGSGRFAGKARVCIRSSDHTIARAVCDGIVAQLAEPNAPQSDGAVAR